MLDALRFEVSYDIHERSPASNRRKLARSTHKDQTIDAAQRNISP